MRLNICICSNRPHPPQFTLCLAHLLVTLANGSPFDGLGIQIKQTSLLPIGRQSSAMASIEAGFTHILFLDDDSVFPPNAAHRMIARDKRIVAANFVMKRREARYCAADLGGKEMISLGKTGVEEAARIGFGLTLVDLDVFRKTPAPHFEIRWNDERQRYVGEDMYFSDKVRASGEQLWVDHDLSVMCGHIGDYVYAADPDFQSNMSG